MRPPSRVALLARDVPIGAVLTRNVQTRRWYCAGMGAYADDVIRQAIRAGICEAIESTGQVQRIDHQARRVEA